MSVALVALSGVVAPVVLPTLIVEAGSDWVSLQSVGEMILFY